MPISTDPNPASFAGLVLDRPRIMGIVNVTPDSFFEGSQTLDPSVAIQRGRSLIDQGADMIDVGGESTRPGADPVSIDEEIARVIPVVEALALAGACVSIDTRHAPVMAAAINAGASVVNDITALQGDAQSVDVVASSGASVILMHMQGEPGTMQDAPSYNDVVTQVGGYLVARIRACEQAGIAKQRIAIDPGIGFGKALEHNLELMRNLHAFAGLGCSLVLGVSRKSFIGHLTGEADPAKRLTGSVAAALAGVAKGAKILRVHDVAETRQALDVWAAV